MAIKQSTAISRLIQKLGEHIPEADTLVLLSGDSHPYWCKCAVCRGWWRLMGRDPDTGKFGPFTDTEMATDD